MPTWQRIYIVAQSAVIGFALAYVACDFAAWPRLTYFPYERSWAFIAGYPGPVPSNYVGTILWGVGGAITAAALAFPITLLIARPLHERWLRLLGAWSLTAFIYAGLYYTWNLWPF